MGSQLFLFESEPVVNKKTAPAPAAPKAAPAERHWSDDLLDLLDRQAKQMDEQTKEMEDMMRRMGIDPAELIPPSHKNNSAKMPTITDEVKAVLADCTITEATASLPATQLERKLYEQVKKVLEGAGGKWSTKEQAFLFKRDPRTQLGLSLATGQVVSTKKTTQAFYTPATVVQRCLAHAPALAGLAVLEPSAGEGAFAEPLRAAGADVHCAEFDSESVKVLERKGFAVKAGDFLQMAPEYGLFDLVVMNPPFSKGQDMKHVAHAFKFLKPGGTLLAIISPTFQFGTTAPAKSFRAFVEANGGVVEEFEPGAFKESGTGVRTVLIKLAAPSFLPIDKNTSI